MNRILLSAWLLLATSALPAAPLADLEALRQVAIRFLQTQLPQDPAVEARVQVPPLDRRLRLAACEDGPHPFLPAGQRAAGRTSVGLRCRGPRPWTVYIPAQVQLSGPVLVARRPLPRGTRLAREDLHVEYRDLARLGQDYLTAPEQAVGRELTRAVAPGRPIKHRFLKAPAVISRGERVTLVARSGGLEVRMKGEALEDAGLGEVVRVRNLRSRRVVEGRVESRGVVEVGL